MAVALCSVNESSSKFVSDSMVPSTANFVANTVVAPTVNVIWFAFEVTPASVMFASVVLVSVSVFVVVCWKKCGTPRFLQLALYRIRGFLFLGAACVLLETALNECLGKLIYWSRKPVLLCEPPPCMCQPPIDPTVVPTPPLGELDEGGGG